MKQIVSQENFIPPKQGKPKDTSGAGSRSELKCSQKEGAIRPVMPKENYGLTLEERPTIFIEIPKTSARQVVLMFRDETGEFYERAFLPITDRDGIVGFALPKQKQPLAVGKTYQWSLVVVCGQSVQPDDPVFMGWVHRMPRTSQFESELRQKKTAIEQVIWYGAKGYWYDMVSTIVQARQSNPKDAKLVAVWQDLLDSERMGTLKSKSFK
ncbi:DUF928 domain-containing protein [Scytonema sp. HK-05]|uniref:DUF928 domain-containing protein n=1 Tax=Scytonema sp. HK-05 TaxID=1137095 RepID=UPI0013014364|nr:DUF928 domain-containing protein [Scytonema sp. HK-05]